MTLCKKPYITFVSVVKVSQLESLTTLFLHGLGVNRPHSSEVCGLCNEHYFISFHSLVYLDNMYKLFEIVYATACVILLEVAKVIADKLWNEVVTFPKCDDDFKVSMESVEK